MQRRHLKLTHRLQERAVYSVQPQLLTRSSVFIPPTLKPLSVSFQEQGACSCTSRSCDRSGRMKSLAVPPHNSKHRLMGEMRENNFCSFSSVTLKALPLFVVCSFAVTQEVYIWLWNLFSGSISAPKMCLHKTAAPELRLPPHSIPFPRSPFVFFFKVRLPAPSTGL